MIPLNTTANPEDRTLQLVGRDDSHRAGKLPINADIATAFPGSPLTELATVPIDLRHVAKMLGAVHDADSGRFESPFGPKRDILKATIAYGAQHQRAA